MDIIIREYLARFMSIINRDTDMTSTLRGVCVCVWGGGGGGGV